MARRLSISSLEVERVIDVGVTDAGGNLGHFVVGRVIAADPAPERRPAPALPGRRRQTRAAADRLRRVELRRRRDGRRRPARRAPARLPRTARGASAPRRGLAGDDPRRGRGRARPRPLRDHAAAGRARAWNAAGGRPAARRPGARRDADDEPARPALDGRRRARGRRAVRRRPPPPRPGGPARDGRGTGRSRGRGLRRVPAVHRARLPRRAGRPVAAVAAHAPPSRRHAVDLERRRRDELRDARLGEPAPRVRPGEARGRPDRRPPRARGGDAPDARRHASGGFSRATS